MIFYEIILFFNCKTHFETNQIRRLFEAIVKAKMIKQCKSVVCSNMLTDISKFGVLYTSMKKNDIYSNLENF